MAEKPVRKGPSFLMMLPVIIFAAFAISAGYGMFNKTEELPSTRLGQAAPGITSDPLPGYAPVDMANLTNGEVTIVNFWASWCPPCRAEHPNLLKLEAEGKRIIGVNFKDDATDASTYLERSDNPFVSVAFDPGGRTAIDWGVTAPPETFILAPDGTVLYRFIGPLVGTDYEKRFLPELNKALAGG